MRGRTSPWTISTCGVSPPFRYPIGAWATSGACSKGSCAGLDLDLDLDLFTKGGRCPFFSRAGPIGNHFCVFPCWVSVCVFAYLACDIVWYVVYIILFVSLFLFVLGNKVG